MSNSRECQFHGNCGGWCETEEEIEHCLCVDCLQAEKDEDVRAAELSREIERLRARVSELEEGILKALDESPVCRDVLNEAISKQKTIHTEHLEGSLEGWQPICTAPKDQRIMLGFLSPVFTGVTAVFGSWDEDRYARHPKPFWSHDLVRLTGRRGAVTNAPTHWMPLPLAPKQDGEQTRSDRHAAPTSITPDSLINAIKSAKLGRLRREAQEETCAVFAAALHDVLIGQGVACRMAVAHCRGTLGWSHSLVEVDGRYYDSMGEFSTEIYRKRAKIHPAVTVAIDYQPDSRVECFESDSDGLHAWCVKALTQAFLGTINVLS